MSDTLMSGDLGTALRAIQAKGDGVLHLRVVRPDDMLAIIAASSQGNAEALLTCRIVIDALCEVYKAPRRAPKLCGSCPRCVRPKDRFSVAIAAPACNDPSQAIALVICAHCGTDVATVKRKATEALRKLWPDLRDITPTHRGGHA